MNTKSHPALLRTLTIALPIVATGLLAACGHHSAVPTPYGPPAGSYGPPSALYRQMAQASVHDHAAWGMRILCILGGAVFGGLIGAFFSDRARKFRMWVGLGLLALIFVGGILISNTTAFICSALVSGVVVYGMWRLLPTGGDGLEAIFGNAHPATRAEIEAAGHVSAVNAPGGRSTGRAGIPLGVLISYPTN